MDILKLAEAVDLNVVPEPKTKVGETERVVGVASDGLKKLYGLYVGVADRYNGLVLEIDELTRVHTLQHVTHKNDESCCESFRITQRRIADQSKRVSAELSVYKEIFWNAVRVEFPELVNNRHLELGIRKGFRIVILDMETNEQTDIKREHMLIMSIFGEVDNFVVLGSLPMSVAEKKMKQLCTMKIGEGEPQKFCGFYEGKAVFISENRKQPLQLLDRETVEQRVNDAKSANTPHEESEEALKAWPT